MLAPGVLLSDRYRLDARLATGGMGDVWRGTDLLLGRQVAVKVLLPGLVTESDFITRFRAEAQMMAALHHPGIVAVYDCGEHPLPEGGRADYLVMEYVAGEPLSQRLEDSGRLGVEQTLSVVAQAARALDAAHHAGIVHRDVKPGNLLIQPDGTVVLVDFGVARSSHMARITSTNAVPGTALYMAPEQAAGRPVSAATDIYALGAVAYHCLAGEPPYSGKTPLEVAIKHLHDEPPVPPEDLPAPVAALINKALAKAPGDRHPSAAALATEADAALAATSTAATGTATTGGTLRGAAPPPLTSPTGTAGEARAGAALAGLAAGAAGSGRDRVGPGTLPDLPVVPADHFPSGAAGTPPPSRVRAYALAGGVSLLVVGALAGVLGFGLLDGEPGGKAPAPPAPSGTPAAGPGADRQEKPDDDGGPSDRPSGGSAPGTPSAPVVTGSPGRSGGATSGAPSTAPTTAASTPSPTSDDDSPPPASEPPPATPDAPEEPGTSVAPVARPDPSDGARAGGAGPA
ncbi:protein kinase [Micromonospora sp. NPDC050397]|uniref:serine/threonine-protein kinase n=1 Tax=Micromonospora sp. NPDC050397 TaxID=3364279 RepID=UPI0038509742